jgi:hypothetical protein
MGATFYFYSIYSSKLSDLFKSFGGLCSSVYYFFEGDFYIFYAYFFWV